ncbi:MAG: HAD hydrolase-like protein [Candidatus Micrarchaeaceae archaeon]|jgi:phosphoglycolate phosphatase-like HAD superfamily hydrolase|nr:HAD family hydrolase [Candidatus Micrarchaeota archaeon]HII09563.1 HAD family hydrolase [Candidatus Micrarchaeota archaeon]
MVEKAVLFDVQETLIREAKEVSQYYSEAIRNAYGFSIDDIRLADYEGYTVQETLAAILAKQGLTRGEIYEKQELFLEELGYAHYNVAGHDRAVLVDGAQDILNRLNKKNDVVIGVATGQLERILRNLFDRAGLNYGNYFKFGAYGNVSESMPKIIDAAIHRASEDYGIDRRHVSFVCGSGRSFTAAQSVGVNAVGIIADRDLGAGLNPGGADHIVGSLKECGRFII